jgi:DNA-binding LacI/PurR family transcriptional regulator
MPKTCRALREGARADRAARAHVPGFKADVVELPDREAAYEGVTHLLRLGYRRIGLIGGLIGASTTKRRLDGYRAALRDAHLPIDPALVAEGDFKVESGYRAGLEMLKHRPDAVFIANYLMCVGFMKALAVPSALPRRSGHRHL